MPGSDEDFMRKAIALAWKGAGWTNPNPLVGAVLARDGRIIGGGCHERYGELHAERNALKDCRAAGEDPSGSTLYVTLEPCNHTGKQPPCTQAVIEAGISRVVVGSRDPNPLVSGAGNQRLRDAGIRVRTDVLRGECDALNPIFFHYITRKRPYVVAKWAMTADGKIATRTGDAHWVSGEASRADCHELRHRLASICVGVGTVLADDPTLTARRPHPSKQPLRVVCDTLLRTPRSSRLLSTLDQAPLAIAHAEGEAWEGEARQGERCLLLPVPLDARGRLSLPHLLDELGKRGIDSMLLEGGSTLHASFLEAGLVDEAVIYLAPKICGGKDAPSPVGGEGVSAMADAQQWRLVESLQLGEDLRLTLRPNAGGATETAAETAGALGPAAAPAVCTAAANRALRKEALRCSPA